MTRWRERIEDLLYAGESVRETVEVDGACVAVTSHRVLAFTSGMDGPNFRSVDRPNVVGVDTGAQSATGLLEPAAKSGVVGVVLLGAGWIFDFGSVVGDVDLSGGGTAGRAAGLGGVMKTVAALLAVLRNLDQYMQLLGALALLLAAVMVGVYWYLRDPTLVIEVDGAEDIHVPRPGGESDAIGRLERAISPDTPATAERPSRGQGRDQDHGRGQGQSQGQDQGRGQGQSQGQGQDQGQGQGQSQGQGRGTSDSDRGERLL